MPESIKSPGYKVIPMGCGPARKIPFQIGKATDNVTPAKGLRYMIEATVISKVKTLRLSLVLGIDWRPNRTYLGHGMCAGNVAKLPKGKYSIRLRTIDYAGNISPPSKAITATVP